MAIEEEEGRAPRFTNRRGLGARRGWDVRMGDDEDESDLVALGASESSLSASWHIIESSADERMLGAIATRLDGGTATIEAVLVESRAPPDVASALLSCAEAAARSLGATTCRAQVPRGDTAALLARAGYAAVDGAVEKSLVGAPPVVEDAPADPLIASLDLAASLKEMAGAIVDAIPDRDDNPPDDPETSLEDLVGSLLSKLKTDEGRLEFHRLAAKQARERPTVETEEARRAPRAFVQRPPEEAAPTTTATTTTIGDAHAVAELFCADGRFARTATN